METTSNTQQNRIVKITYYADAGHGWYRIKKTDAEHLGLLAKISGYSYERGASIYLEEDRDAGLLFEALGTTPNTVWNVKAAKHVDRSPVRSFTPYQNT